MASFRTPSCFMKFGAVALRFGPRGLSSPERCLTGARLAGTLLGWPRLGRALLALALLIHSVLLSVAATGLASEA